MRPRENTNGSPILTLDDISKSIGGLSILNNVSFSVRPHTISSLIGPNGAGKTTALNIISGVMRLSSGRIFFEGRLISGERPDRVTELGIGRTFQQTQVFKNMTVEQNVMVGFHPRTRSGLLAGIVHLSRERREERQVRAWTEDLMGRFNLTELAGQPAGTIPLRDQKWLEIARTMAGQPRLMMLDEPASGLNPLEIQETRDLILRLKQQGVTILLVEHNMELVMDISDTVIVLNYGQKIAEGKPEEIQRNRSVIDAYLGWNGADELGDGYELQEGPP